MTPQTESSLGERPSRMKPADLGSAFGGSSRSDGLGGRLAPLRPASKPVIGAQPTTDDQVEAQATSEVAPPSMSPISGRRPSDGRARTSKPAATAPDDAAATTGGSQTIVVYLGVSIRERLRAGAGDRTFTDVVLAALDSSYAKLGHRFNEASPPTGSMFAGRGRPRNRRNGEARVQVSLRPLREDIRVIDRLAKEVNAPSRSALIEAALEEYLQ